MIKEEELEENEGGQGLEGGGAFGKMGRGKEKGKGSGLSRRHKLFSLWRMVFYNGIGLKLIKRYCPAMSTI